MRKIFAFFFIWALVSFCLVDLCDKGQNPYAEKLEAMINSAGMQSYTDPAGGTGL